MHFMKKKYTFTKLMDTLTNYTLTYIIICNIFICN